MLNTQFYRLLAGNPEKWDAEVYRAQTGLLQPGESLIEIQERQHQQGRRSLVLDFISGDEPEDRDAKRWVLRLDSNLDGRRVLFGPYLDKRVAIMDGKSWANQDPANREFYALKRDVPE